MPFAKDIPCIDCESEKNRLVLRGYNVLGCDPTEDARMCRISYERPAAAAPAAAPKKKKGKKATGSAGQAHAETLDADAPWIAIARRELERGVKEFSGDADNPRIVEYHSMTSFGSKDDETAWCSSFVNWCMAGARIRGTGNAAARSWLHWGDALETPRPGCVVVLWRGSPEGWQGHVAFYVRQHLDNSQYIILLGGNQGDSVCEAAYDKSRVLGFRWPRTTQP